MDSKQNQLINLRKKLVWIWSSVGLGVLTMVLKAKELCLYLGYNAKN